MSTVDNRVVRMQFDNAQFEAGVAKSMKTLDMLNDKLQFKEASKGLSALMVTVEGVSTQTVSTALRALDKVSSYTTTVLGMMAQKIKSEFADKIVNALESIPARAMNQIKTGGWNRANNIANAQFQIEGLKFSWEKVKEAADYAVTDTAYGLDAAAKAASQLAASGVDFENIIGKDGAGKDITQMHKSLRAISGVAAMTNSSYEDIAHTFTRIAGQGRVMGEDLNSLASRGLNAAATLAKSLNMTESEVRDMVSKGQIDFAMFSEAMDEAYGEHAKEANKTFSGALSNMKAALSRIGAIFAQPVIDKTNTFFVAVTSRIKEFQKALNDTTGYKITEKGLENIKKKALEAAKARKDLTTSQAKESFVEAEVDRLKKLALGDRLKESLDTGDVEDFKIIRFAGHFAEAWESAVKAASTIVSSLDLSWFTDIATFLDNGAIKAKAFFDGITDYFEKAKDKIEAASNAVSEITGMSLTDFHIIEQVMAGTLGTMEYRWNKIDEILGKEGEGKRIQGYLDQLASVGYEYKAIGLTEEWIKNKEKEEAAAVKDTASEMANLVAERKKEAFEANSQLSAEEKLYGTIAYGLGIAKNVISDMKTVVGNVVKVIGNAGSQILTLIGYFDAVRVNLRLDNFTKGVAGISDAIGQFSDSIKITQEMADSLGEPLSRVGEFITDLYEDLTNTVKEFFEFAAACMAAEESLEELGDSKNLTPLQKTVISVLRVIKNLWKTMVNIAKAIVSIVKPIIKAFRTVFDPSGITQGVADFSEGLANLSEKFILSENGAKALEVIFGGLFSVIQKLVTIFSKVVGGVTKFITSIGKARKEVKSTKEQFEDVEETGTKTVSIFDNLKKIFEGFAKKIQELPGKFEELKKKLKEQEGIQHLKESFERLWKTIKDGLTTSIDPLKEGMSEVAEKIGGEGTTAIGAFADGIGKVADKIATFIDNIPNYISEIEAFFDRLKEKAENFVDKLHITNLFDSIGNAFDITAKTEGSIIDKIKAFAGSIYEKITEVVSTVDWSKVAKTGLLGLMMGNLFNFLKITSSVKSLIDNVAAVPKTLTGIFKSLSGLMTQGKDTLKAFTQVYVFTAIVQAMGTLVAAVLLLADLNEEKLKTGLAAFTWIGIIFAILLKALSNVTSGGIVNQVNKETKEIKNLRNGIINIDQSFSGPAGIGVAIIAFGASIALVVKAVKTLVDTVKGASPEQLGNAIKLIKQVFFGLAGVVAAFVIASAIATKFSVFEHTMSATLKSAALTFIGVGASVWLIAKAIKGLSECNIDDQAIYAVYGIIGMLSLFLVLLGGASRWSDPKSIILIGAVLAILAGVIATIVGEIIALSFVMNKMSAVGGGETIFASLAVIVSLILTLSLFVFALGRCVKNVDSAKPVSTTILSIAAVIFIACKGFEIISKTMQDVKDPVIIVAAALSILGTILVLTIGVAIVLKQLQAHRGFLRDDSANTVLALAGVFAAIGVAMWLIGESAAKMMRAEQGGGDPLGSVILLLFGMLAAVGLIAKIMTQTDSTKNDAAVDALLSMSITFVAIGIAMMALAKAAQMLGAVSWPDIGKLAVIFVLLFGVLGVFAALAGSTKMGEGLDKVAVFVLSISVALLVLAGAVALLGVGFGKLGPGLVAFAMGLQVLSKTFEENKLAAIIAIALIALVIFAVMKLTTIVGAAVSTIGKILEVALTLIQGVLGSITGFIQKFKKSSSAKWFNELPTKTKMTVAAVLVGIAGAIVSASPEVLESIKKVIKKVIYFIVDIIPMVVQGLFDILLRIINALADVIRRNSAAVANAVWNVIEALLEVVIDLIGQGLAMIFTYTGSMLNKLGIDTKVFDGIGDKITNLFSKVKGSLREGLSAANDYASSTEILTEAYSGLDASMNAVTDDILKQNNIVKDAAGNYTSLNGGIANLVQTAKDGLGNGLGGISVEGLLGSHGGGGGYFDMDLPIDISTSTMLDPSSMGESDLTAYTEGLLGNADPSTGTDFMAAMGLDNEAMEGYATDGATTYTTTVAQELGSQESLEEVRAATTDVTDTIDDEVDRYKTTLTQTTIPKTMDAAEEAMKRESYKTQRGASYVIRGIIDALNKASTSIYNAGAMVGDGLHAGFVGPRGIDANSPSKKFYQGGLYCIMGVEEAIKDNSYLATNAMTDLSSQMIDSFGNPLDYISKVASGEIAYDPTIRPVMDMSDAYRASIDVNSMFRNQSISLSGLSGQIAYDMTNLNGSNAAVVSEIQALREDMDYMTDELTNMQIVMDTGALVGSTVGAYDQALGSRQVYSKRGTI